MHVLAIGSDRSLFDARSESARRQIAYGERFGKLDIVVFSLKRRGYTTTNLSSHVRVHPTQSRNRLFYVFDALRIARQFDAVDVVTVQDPFEAGLVGRIVARALGARLHVQVHTDFLSPAFARMSLINRARVHMAKSALARAQRVRVVSERIKKSLESRYRLHAPVTVLPIFTDVARFAAALPVHNEALAQFTKKLLVVSRLEKEKNVALAIRSFAKVAPENACLIVLGEGSERGHLETLAAVQGVKSRVFFLGTQEPAPYYALADLVLVPSVYEGYGNVIVEALAAGKPVLATDIGIAREAGAIVTTQDHFADALSDWFQNGPHAGALENYPYTSFEKYADAYCADIVSTKA